MSLFRPFSKAGGAIHDLEHIGGLSSDRTIPLLLSPRVLYVLTNLVNVDLGFECRWATQLQDNGYQRLTTDDAQYQTFLDVVSEAGYQLRERQDGMGTLLNYKDFLLENVMDENAGAGFQALDITGPGATEVWNIDHVEACDITSAGVTIELAVVFGSGGIRIERALALAAGVPLLHHQPIRLSGDAIIVAYFYGVTAGDTIYLRIQGYKMDLVV